MDEQNVTRLQYKESKVRVWERAEMDELVTKYRAIFSILTRGLPSEEQDVFEDFVVNLKRLLPKEHVTFAYCCPLSESGLALSPSPPTPDTQP